jgi:hypothetical protein
LYQKEILSDPSPRGGIRDAEARENVVISDRFAGVILQGQQFVFRPAGIDIGFGIQIEVSRKKNVSGES